MINRYLNTRYRMTNIFLIAMVLFTSCATPPRITYEGERNQEDKYHGQGVITYSNGEKWEGEFKDGEPYNGQGTYTFPDGEKYAGEFKDGILYGKGTFTFLDVYKYAGEFKGKNFNEIKHFLTSDSGTRYDGIITRGTKELGFGIFIVKSKISYLADINRFGFKYEGEFKNDKFNGQGTWSIPDGQKYIGEFKDGKRHGKGTLTSPDGSKYVGEFKDSKLNGQGTYTFSDGEKYVGEFKYNYFNGQGTLTSPDGSKYVGEYKNGKINGKGVFYRVNGKIQSGAWVNDTFQKNWTIEAVDNFLRNKYPQFKGLNYSTPITSVPSQNNEVYLPPPPDNPSFIAVVDFTGNNVSEGDCRALTDRLRAELFNTKYFKVIEREMMEEIIKEQGFQQSGCSSDECMVEVGKLIGVEKIVGGSISKVGSTYSVSSKIVSVETGKILKGATYDYKGEIDELLTTGMKMVAYELLK
jgi:TolB-like protein